jgi:hypothetical protein
MSVKGQNSHSTPMSIMGNILHRVFRGCLLLIGVAAFPISTWSQEAGDDPPPAEVYSGPQKDEALPELKVTRLFAEGDSTEVVLVPNSDASVQVLMFVHERTRPTFGLLRTIAGCCEHLKDSTKGSVIFLTGDVAETVQWSQTARRAMPAGVLTTVSPDGVEGPGAWGLNRNMNMTVIVAKDGKVARNFAIIQPSAAEDGPKIARAIAEVAGAPAPTDEQLANWSGASMREMSVESKVDIRGLLGPVIRKGSTTEQVEEAAKKVEEAAEKDAATKRAIGQACGRVVNSGKLEDYGNETSQRFLKKWAEVYNEK